MEYYSAITKNEIMPFTITWMDLEIIIPNEVRKRKAHSYGIVYMWNLKYDTNKLIYKTKRLTDIERKHDYQRGKAGTGGDKLGVRE